MRAISYQLSAITFSSAHHNSPRLSSWAQRRICAFLAPSAQASAVLVPPRWSAGRPPDSRWDGGATFAHA